MSADTLQVKGPYSDGTWAVVQRGADGKIHGRGFFKSRGLAYARLDELRGARNGGQF